MSSPNSDPASLSISFSMRMLLRWLRISQRNAMYRSAAQLHAMLGRNMQAAPAPKSDAQLKVQPLPAPLGWQCWQLSPQQPSTTSLPCWLYLHGGAYVRPITRWHWRMLRELVLGSGCTVVVAQYPLAPQFTCCATMTDLLQAAVQWLAPHARWGLMGDSAGAGMAVALTLAQRDAGLAMAEQLLLITPWLDVTLQGDACHALAALDPMLGLDGAREAGRLYAGKLSTSHPWVSPAYADLHKLPPISLWCAQHDVCTPASLAFAERARQAGCDIHIHHGRRMPHAWPLLPTPEAHATRQQLITRMRSEDTLFARQ